MFPVTLALHSFVRWFVLLSLIISIFVAYRGWLTNKTFQKRDSILRQATVSISHLQFTIGIVLYLISPIANYFLRNFSEGIHIRDMRFFGMEHITMMVIAVAVITHGATLSKKRASDREKFKTMAIYFTIAVVIILLSIPWPFSPFTARPYWRFW